MQKINEEELKKHVGDRLKLFRLSKNKLQRELAEKFDITVGVYNGYETGNSLKKFCIHSTNSIY